jgi:hypothetical protein
MTCKLVQVLVSVHVGKATSLSLFVRDVAAQVFSGDFVRGVVQ